MDRRSFLTTLGLGGIALTLPKPLSVVAATLADLERPPLHAGYCKMVVPQQFDVHRLLIGTPRGLSVDDQIRFWDGTQLSMFLPGWTSAPFMKMRTGLIGDAAGGPLSDVGSDPPALLFRRSLGLHRGQMVEFWCVPCETQTGRMGKVVAAHIGLKGIMRPEHKPRHFFLTSQIKDVRLDRARAIELGLASPDEPVFGEGE